MTKVSFRKTFYLLTWVGGLTDGGVACLEKKVIENKWVLQALSIT